MNCIFFIFSWGFTKDFLLDLHLGYLPVSEKRESSSPWTIFCRFCCKEWSKVMLEYEFIIHKLILNVWDEKMINEILIDGWINWSFQEAELSNTGGKYATLSHYRLKYFNGFFEHLASYLLYGILHSFGGGSFMIEENRECRFTNEDGLVSLIRSPILIIYCPYWTPSFLCQC